MKKLADAKENPEEYPSVTKKSGKCGESGGAAPCIRTPRLRMMLWKLMSRRSPAWIQAIWVRLEKWRIFIGSQAADEEETDEPEKAEPDTTDSHENVEEKTDAVNEEKVDE